MKKRIILFILALSFAILPTALSASAEKTKPEHEKELVDLLTAGYELDIESETVSRSEFLTLLLASAGIDYSGASGRETFEDVSKESELSGIVNAALEKGMVSQGAKFYPDEAITYAQAVKMSVAFVNYSIQSEMAGGYPQGYANTAFRLGILDNIDYSDAKRLNGADAYRMVYNTVHVLMPETNEKGEIVSYTGDKCESVLSKYHNIYKSKGIVTADKRTSLYDADKAVGSGYIKIGNTEYLCAKDGDFLGLNVTIYYKEDKSLYNSNEIVMIYPSDNEMFSMMYDDFNSTDGRYLEYYRDDKSKRIKLSDDIRVIKNGTANYPDNMNEFFKTPNGVFEFIDNNSDGTYDVVKAKVYKYIHVLSADDVDGYIFDRNESGNTLDLSAPGCEYEIYEERYNGMAKIDLNEIEKNSLIAYMQTDDKKYCTATVLKDSEGGTISSVNDDEVVINGVKHTLNSYAKKYFKFKAGDSGMFYFGIDGSLVSYVRSENDIMYGWVVSAWTDEIDKDAHWVKLFAGDNVMRRVKLAKKPMLDGVRQSAENVYKSLKTLIAGNDVDRMIRFKINRDNELIMADTGENVTTIGDGFKTADENNSLRIFYRERSGLQYKRSNGVFGRKVKIDGNTAIFAIPPEGERDTDSNFGILTTDYFSDDDRTQTITAYDISAETGATGALMIKASAVGANPSYWPEGIGVIEKKMLAVNEDDESCYLLSIWKYDGTYDEFYTTEYVQEEADKAGAGDIIRYEVDSKKQIKSLAVDYDLSENKIYIAESSDCEYQTGYVYSYDNGTITLMQNDIDISNTEALNNINISDLFITDVKKVLVVNVNGRDGKIISTQVLNTPDSSVRTIRGAGEQADKMVLRGRYWCGVVGVIYRYND